MTPCLRISKKVRARVYRLWRQRPDLCFDDAASLLGYSPTELTRLTRRWVRATTRESRLLTLRAAVVKHDQHNPSRKP